MEEVLIVLLHGLFEAVLQLLTYLPFDWPLSSRADRDGGLLGRLILLALCGMLLGGFCTWVHPHVFLPAGWQRLAWLIVGPLVNGALAWSIAGWRRRRGADVRPSTHAWYASAFSLGFILIRFAYAGR